MTMLAYHSDPAVKRKIVAKLRAHAKADELIKGVYWENGKGCAIGCAIESGDHAQYEPRFGIPQVLARLEDRIFEGLPNEDAQRWPVQFMSAIKPGADLSDIWPLLAIWLLADPDRGVIRFAKTDAQRAAIDGVAELYRQRVPLGDHRWALARKNAYASASASADSDASYAAAASADSAAYASAASADSAAYASDAAYASAASADSAASAAYAASAASDSDAYAASYAARYAASAASYASADSASYAAYAASAARSIHWKACAAKLLELLRAA